VKAEKHPEPEPRPTVGGSFTLDPLSGKWLPTEEVQVPAAADSEPTMIEADNG